MLGFMVLEKFSSCMRMNFFFVFNKNESPVVKWQYFKASSKNCHALLVLQHDMITNLSTLCN